MTEIQNYLFSQADQKYRDFTLSLFPLVGEKTFIGVRLPVLKKYAKDLDASQREEFLNSLPHTFHEENILHAFIISSVKDYDLFIKAIENHQFDSVTHNKAIQKALESYLVNEEHKNSLKTLKIKEK